MPTEHRVSLEKDFLHKQQTCMILWPGLLALVLLAGWRDAGNRNSESHSVKKTLTYLHRGGSFFFS